MSENQEVVEGRKKHLRSARECVDDFEQRWRRYEFEGCQKSDDLAGHVYYVLINLVRYTESLEEELASLRKKTEE